MLKRLFILGTFFMCVLLTGCYYKTCPDYMIFWSFENTDFYKSMEVAQGNMSKVQLKDSNIVYTVSELVNDCIHLDWGSSDISDAKLYHVQVSQDKDYFSFIYNDFVVGEEFHLEGLDKGDFYVRVEYVGLDGFYDWSDSIKLSNHEHNMIKNDNLSSYSTCSKRGRVYLNCSDCSNISIEELPSVDHNLEVVDSQMSTCCVEGYISYNCVDCDYSVIESSELIPHDYSIVNTVDSSCSLRGFNELKCNNCGFVFLENLELKPHTFIVTETTPSTCSEHGYNSLVCTVCELSDKEELELSSHNYVDVYVEEATCVKEGYRKLDCVNCDDVLTETIDKIPHNYNLEERVDSTTSSNGYERYKCSYCGDTYEVSLDKLFGGYVGDLSIPSVGIYVPLYKSCAENNYASTQYICNMSYGAVYIPYWNQHTIIGDHEHESFSALKYVSIGTVAYINGNAYTCIDKFIGRNYGSSLTDSNDVDVSNLEGSLVMYTCNYGDSFNVLVTMWQ